jgi:pretoxin HINT domain-containing protein
VPTLLDNLSAPLQSAFEVIRDPDGSVHYVHSVYREGAFADWSFKTKRSIYQPWSMASAAKSSSSGAKRSDPFTSVSNTPARAVSSAAAARSAQRYQDEIIDGEMQVAQTNLRAAAVNEPIYKLLSSVTGKNFESEPRPWWDWWKEYTDYYASKDRPTYSVEQSSSDYVVPPPPSSVAVECFARGTPVWTKTGQRPIESLEMGDLVLSQNVDTGEMKYKPVIARTLRPAGPIVQISTGAEKILATRGHPLWVDGVGWRMSKELGDGAVLHSLAGVGRIEAVGPSTEAETYNLVVADFNTYFVGKSGILAHDNTPRRPTQSILPGIRGTAKK